MTSSAVVRVVGHEIQVATLSGSNFRLNLERCRSIPNGYFHGSSKTWRAPASKEHAAAIRDLFESDLETDPEFDELAKQNVVVEEAQKWKTEDPDDIPNCPTPAWRHQRAAFHFAKDLDACFLYMAMGTGKSAVVVHLVREMGLKKVLILSPVSVMHVWPFQFAEHYGANAPAITLLAKGTSAKKADQVDNAIQRDRLCVVVNYESAYLGSLGEMLLLVDWDLVVLDESHKVKSPGAKRSLFVGRLRQKAKKRLCLTGTPAPNNNLDYYGQFRFLDPTILGTNFVRFKARYAVLSQQQINGRQIQRIIGFQNQEELAQKISRITFYAGEDVVELPDRHHVTRTIKLNAKERKAYEKMNREFVVWLNDSEDAVTATNFLVQTLRLQQITSGFLQDRDRDIFERIGNSKERALLDIVEGIDEPIAVFCQFVEDLRTVELVAGKLHRPYGEISGRRKDVEGKWKDGDGDILGIQIQAGGLGIDLTRARYAVYFSLGYSLGDYEQSVKRLHRPGQDRVVTYFHLVGEDTIDETIYRALANKKKSVEELVKMILC